MARQAADRQPAPTALITGASSGIGEALAGCFAAAGHDLVLVARRADLLEALAQRLRQAHPVSVRVMAADLAVPGAAAGLATQLRRKRVRVDVLVNSAGVLAQGDFSAMALDRQAGMVDLNVAGLTAMLAAFAPAMHKRGRGRVLNRSLSAGAHAGGLRCHQGLRAVADRIVGRRVAGQWRDDHGAVPGYHRHADAAPGS